MAASSTASSLRERLRERREEDERILREEHEHRAELIASELRKLGESVRGVVQRELRGIESDMEAGRKRAGAALLKAWGRSLALGLSLFLGICLGSWGLTQWLSRQVEEQIEALTVLRVDIEEARATLARIEEKTWGLELTQIDGERFVVLPAGTLDSRPWTVGGRPALKLSSE